LDAEVVRLLLMVDLIVCSIFFGDFVLSLRRAPSKWGYMKRWGWLDLLSSIPAIGWFRIARVARIIRILRILRSLQCLYRLLQSAKKDRTGTVANLSFFIAMAVLMAASVGMLIVERNAGGNIKTAEDALWWCLTTITTVGYGDLYPSSNPGRVIGAAVMAVGVALFGVYTAWMGAWLLAGINRERDDSANLRREALATEVAELRTVILSMEQRLRESRRE
jgi:voltage-gated potassium channel